MNLSRDHLELLSALNARGVKYLVVGAYATGFHSEPRATKDLDIFIRADEENSRAVFLALTDFGAPLAGLTPEDFNDGQSWFQMGRDPERIDLLQKLSGVAFDESWQSRAYATLAGDLSVPVISADKLIQNKLAAGRDQDLVDVKKIKAAQTKRKP